MKDETAPGLRVRRVQAAYVQIATQLREQIIGGALPTGTRLPSEAELCTLFGVSRSTVREALRLLTSQQLIDTTRGVTGGSFVAAPDAGTVAENLGGTLGLLVNANNLSVDNLIEARLMIEPPAARLAAERAGEVDLESLRRTMEQTAQLDPDKGFVLHWDFHTTLVSITGNPLLRLMCQPVNVVLRSRMHRDRIAASRWAEIDTHHEGIYAAVAAGDGETAERLTREHLVALRPVYERMKTGSENV
ncbi:FadR/GntR family transcriptional regulator [Amycolatopsis echigonensis]|uniref:FadR family transcriptional regulator n=1 Tax=Amycolatopsis echigonensis TaxID=2576905 RepID=A0A2N3WN06_9PSEU|nr:MULTISPECIES: FadR/GntR family transcriptional regulator [Amycolatopsis]MBB2505909.1 FadR family transcriptional regulator [Amycolatopsis echigonensis]PKV95256.1 GntR family transcriptional regulator [Amycolatopsis niigatensis]